MKPAPTAAAALWNERYRAPGDLFGAAPNAYLRRHGDQWRAGDRVLCVADGDGRNSVWLAQQGLAVDAFDISRVGVAKARRRAAAAGVRVRYRVGACEDWIWPGEIYDGIAAIFVQFADPPQRARLFDNLQRSLRVGGSLVLQGYTPRQLAYGTGGPPQRSHLYTAPLLRRAFRHMEIIDLSDYEAELDEGARHRGRSALVGLVARKVQPWP